MLSSTNSTNEDWLQLLNFDGHFFGLLALHVFVNKIDIFWLLINNQFWSCYLFWYFRAGCLGQLCWNPHVRISWEAGYCWLWQSKWLWKQISLKRLKNAKMYFLLIDLLQSVASKICKCASIRDSGDEHQHQGSFPSHPGHIYTKSYSKDSTRAENI